MKDVFWIHSIAQLAVLSVPIRVQILGLIRYEAASPKKLSWKFNLTAQNLNYHFNKLHKEGFIYKRYEEKKRGAFESFYQAIAPVFRIDNSLFNDLNNQTYQNCFMWIDQINQNNSENFIRENNDLNQIITYLKNNYKKNISDICKRLEEN